MKAKKRDLTQDQLKGVLKYDEGKGRFYYIVTGRGIKGKGSEAGCVEGSGYRVITIKSVRYYEHRLVWLYVNGAWPEDQVDHINGIVTDNRIVNLRSVTNSENRKNVAISSNNTSGIVGVSWRAKSERWRVSISKKEIGGFDNLLDAACARKSAEIKLGYSPRHGSKS